MGFILFIIASILKWAFSPLLYVYSSIRAAQSKEWNSWHRVLAVSKDQHGNVLGKYFWNDTMIKSYSHHKFGHEDETMSSVYGKNERDGTLKPLGDWVNKNLNKVDPGHSIKAIEEDKL